jgi:nitrite reductase/ring-hydroxylating ferredoxin subunit
VEIMALGHAGLRVVADTVGLIDPWFATTGAFFGAWHQLPANGHLATEELFSPDWVAISHDHQDHLDLATLARVPPRATIFVPDYASKRLVRLVRSVTRAEVVEVRAWEHAQIDSRGSWLTFIPEQSPMCQDAAILVWSAGSSLLDCNDARLTAAQARRAAIAAGGHLDVMTVQTSGASWHPVCYEHPEPVVREISAVKRRSKWLAVRSLLRACSPRVAVPFAGPPCFLDPELRRHNQWLHPPGIFPDLDQSAAWFRENLPEQRMCTLLPGDRLFPTDDICVRDPEWSDFSFANVDAYIDDYARERAPMLAEVRTSCPEPDATLRDRFAEHFARVGELSPYFLQRIAMTVRFEVDGPGGGRWDVELGPDRVRVDLDAVARDVQYRYRVDSRWLAPVVDGLAGWEDLLLSLRFSAWREPDVYNDHLIGLLKHADWHALHAIERYEQRSASNATIRVQGATSEYEIGRYCPHAGEDLTHCSVIEGDVLRCLGHNFEFDLVTGACLNGRCAPLHSRATASTEAFATR